MNALLTDLRYSLRRLAASPGFTLVVVLTLGLAIGATTAIFSVVYANLLRPLPWREPDRLVVLDEVKRKGPTDLSPITVLNFREWRDRNEVFSGISVVRASPFNVLAGGESERVNGARVSANLGSLLGVQPVLGHDFSPADEQENGEPVILLSYGLWQRRFGANSEILGTPVSIDGRAHTIIGVLPPGVTYPNAQTEFWIPFIPRGVELAPTTRFLRITARLKPGVTLETARAHMDVISRQLEQLDPVRNTGWTVSIVPLHEQLVGPIRQSLLILFAAVSFVLLIACANISSLLLARSASRGGELAIRTALGAPRSRLIRQFLTECFVLSLFGATLGAALVAFGLPFLIQLAQNTLPRASEVRLHAPILLFTLVLSVLSTFLFGLIPALRAGRAPLAESLGEGLRRGTTGGARHHRLLSTFVVAEVALTLVLLVSAGLMLRSFHTLSSVSPGFRPQGLLTFTTGVSPARYPTTLQQADYYAAVLERIRAVPGVASAAAVHRLPLGSGVAWTNFAIEGRPLEKGNEPRADYRVAAPAYFETLGVSLVSGRLFTEADRNGTPDVVVINRALARAYFPDENPLGKRVSLPNEETRLREIVGIISDMHLYSLDSEAGPALYVPLHQNSWGPALRTLTFVVRTNGEPAALSSSVRSAVRSVDPEQAVYSVRSMEDVLSASLASRRLNLTLLLIFAGLAAVLAAVGIYGIMSYAVDQRTREFGVRLALGARPSDVLRLVLRRGAVLAMLGVALGIAASIPLVGLLRSLLFGVSTHDVFTFLVVPPALVLVALSACLLPALRATRTDPLAALRHE